MIGLLRERRRRRIRAKQFPDQWREILRRNVPHYGCLPREVRERLEGAVQVFLAEKRFEGAGGLEMTDEIRVTIAAQACILLLGRAGDSYRGLRTIIVYPRAYVARFRSPLAGGLVVEGDGVRLGESWHRGPVVLAWDSVLAGVADAGDGQNVVFHEFAHQLDGEAGGMDGAPALDTRRHYAAWARVLGAEYERLIHEVEANEPTLIRSYGATNPAEFFAVVTELFFERPEALRARHAALYEQFRVFYGQDPAGWRCGGEGIEEEEEEKEEEKT